MKLFDVAGIWMWAGWLWLSWIGVTAALSYVQQETQLATPALQRAIDRVWKCWGFYSFLVMFSGLLIVAAIIFKTS